MKRRFLIVPVIALLLACQDHTAPPTDEARAGGYQYLTRSSERRDVPQLAAPDAFAFSREEALPDSSDALPMDVVSNMVIRTANASIQVDSLEPAVAAVRVLAQQVGGYVANTEIATGKNRLRSATLEVKIPAPRFDEGMSGLNPIGKVEAVRVSAEDVGEQFVDVTARMENSRRLEQRLIGLLANRTGKLKEVLDVEQALARVREEIERHEGRLRYLKAHTATSTLSVYVHEPLPVVGTAGTSVMGDAFKQAWRNFVTLLSLAVQSLGVVVPLGLFVVLCWILTQRWRRLARQPEA